MGFFSWEVPNIELSDAILGIITITLSLVSSAPGTESENKNIQVKPLTQSSANLHTNSDVPNFESLLYATTPMNGELDKPEEFVNGYPIWFPKAPQKGKPQPKTK